ncbi:barstar family protein [Kitasatospora sp. NPDC059747]|uniref:barstar family protein n=1 Tax=Kitasatospora sp. NPDC059747 TaxID=3346930 RepID=UPI0036515CE1
MTDTAVWIRSLTDHEPSSATWRSVDGSRCRTSQGMFAEWAAALGFPGYFRCNWDAFYDCLRDVVSRAGTTGGAPAPATVVVREAGALLADEPAALGVFMGILAGHADVAAADGEPALLLLLDDAPEQLSDLGRRLAAVGLVTELLAPDA